MAVSCERLLEYYLGASAARRVLAGNIVRGQGEKIHAAIMYADLRGFTAMTDRLPPAEVISTLNDYFECATSAVQDNGGEVLKLIGDGMLAAFDIEGTSPSGACCQALDAATEILVGLDGLNRARSQCLEVGVALHRGDVFFGNIGGPARLDFTVIGSAVNEATRIEALCRQLDMPVLVSEVFAQSCSCRSFASLGCYELKGVGEPRRIFAPEPLLHAAALH